MISVSCRLTLPDSSRQRLHPWELIEQDAGLETLLIFWTVDIQDVFRKYDADILNLVKSLGGCGQKCVRERSRSVRHT